MGSGTKSVSIAQLRTRVAALEKRPALASSPALAQNTDMLVGGAPAGVLHEVWTDHYIHAGAMLGFGLGQARGLLSSTRPAVLWLQLVSDSLETGLPYGPGLNEFGFDPARLVIGRMGKIEDLLWAIEEAVACPAVAAVVADIGHHHKALDFTATRRLSLRAGGAGASIFLLRYGQEREASAATYRWHVAPELSAEKPFDARAPGGMRWHVRLKKGQRFENGTRGRGDWILNWTEHGFAIEDDRNGGKQGVDAATAVSGAVPAALGYRLSETA